MKLRAAHRRWLRRLAAVVLLLSITPTDLILSAHPAAAAVPTPPQNVTTTVNGTTVTITWLPPIDSGSGPINLYLLTATDSTGGASLSWGEELACGSCTSVGWPNLVYGHSYTFTISARNTTFGLSNSATAAATIPLSPCPAGQVCVTADATRPGPTESLQAQGLVGWRAYIPTVTDARKTAALKIQNWRAPNCCGVNPSSTSDWSYASTTARSVTLCCVNGLWQQDPANQVSVLGTFVYAYSPWDNVDGGGSWHYYDTTWIPKLLSNLERSNQLPGVNNGAPVASPSGFFDILNECDNEQSFTTYGACYYHNSLFGTPPSVSLLQQQLLHTYNDIRAWYAARNLGTPRFVMPSNVAFYTSITGVDARYNTILPLPLDRLLDWSDAAGLRWDAVSWHEIQVEPPLGSEAAFDNYNESIPAHIEQVRTLLAAHPSSSGTQIFVNENEVSSTGLHPGYDVGRLWALETARVDQANRTCWTDPEDPNYYTTCYDGSLNGLFDVSFGLSLPIILSGPPQSTRPRSVWWVRCEYAQMQGGAKLPTATSDRGVRTLATFQGADGTVRMLVGRDRAWDPTPSVTSVAFQITLPPTLPSATVFVQQIPNSESQPEPTLPPLTQAPTTLTGRLINFTIPSFADNDAYVVTITSAVTTPADQCRSA